MLDCHAYILATYPLDLAGIHVPPGIHPLAFAENKNFGDTTREWSTLGVLFQFVQVGRVNDSRVTVKLNFSLRELEANQLNAGLRHARGARKYGRTMPKLIPTRLDRDQFFRNQLLESSAIIGEESAPDSLASRQPSIP